MSVGPRLVDPPFVGAGLVRPGAPVQLQIQYSAAWLSSCRHRFRVGSETVRRIEHLKGTR